MTWKTAAEELLGHYEECIKITEAQRQSLKNTVLYVDHFFRVIFFGTIALMILGKYYIAADSFGSAVKNQWLLF